MATRQPPLLDERIDLRYDQSGIDFRIGVDCAFFLPARGRTRLTTLDTVATEVAWREESPGAAVHVVEDAETHRVSAEVMAFCDHKAGITIGILCPPAWRVSHLPRRLTNERIGPSLPWPADCLLATPL